MARKLIALVVVGLLLWAVVAAVAQDKAADTKAKHDYIGVDKCKICHKTDKTHPTWLLTKHAKAWESLDSAAQKNPECIACHSTGKLPTGELLTGVQCEACHGAGSAYKTMSIMKDRAQSIANGLLIPDEKTCKNCHNEKVPEQFRPKEPYNFAKMMETGVHERKAKEIKKTE